ncbi:2-dehydropantoate 2-reductase [Diaminobutyricimonas aerilata]|uniref:2-dehydropantoate 2-reductase n=1 Tax=Diaminobutyricimonas aerilata TaxID=1162967 RepID=A0A2M9CLA0_9MICO|nr:2-dehydropantoate 2-reductase [Diaminobutyricimonas aerilata]PJJ72670.1 2-dehydropantoate 2-reductase [Diaminobutyricimonas aerilata]
MRAGVIGAGAVGGALAALLHRGGHEVHVTARGEHLATLRESGLHLTGAWGEHRAAVSAAETLPAGVQFVIAATKAQDAPAAIRANAPVLKGIPLVVVQNGLGGVDAARSAAPDADVIGGLAVFAASHLRPGEVEVTAAGPLYLGGGVGEHDVPARFAASVLSPLLPVEVVADFTGAQWSKLVVNQVNALPAITGMSVQEVVAHSGLRRVMTDSMRENVRVGLTRGIEFGPLQGLTHRRLRLFAALPLSIGQLLPRLMARRMGAVPNPGSTLQSIRRGQPSEIDHLNGAVVRASERTNQTARVNRLLVELVHEVERTGRFLTPDEVLERVAAPGR